MIESYQCACCGEEVAEVLTRLASPWCHECRLLPATDRRPRKESE